MPANARKSRRRRHRPQLTGRRRRLQSKQNLRVEAGRDGPGSGLGGVGGIRGGIYICMEELTGN